jgi:A/G-specific adenine glycosylase
MITLREQIHTYIPNTADEQKAKAHILRQWDVLGDEIFARPDEGHFTASSIILNKERTHMLMVYHNIYDSFSWTGGHADGEQNLLHKAMEEAKEETGIITLIPLTGAILSIDVLPVKVHVKRGKEIKAHQHYNIAYGFIASDKELLQIKPDENSNVCWIALDDWQSRCNEAHMIPVYEKIISRMQELDSAKQDLYSQLPELLLPWFVQHARKLPWREDRDPYHVWLSEIMLQQTRVEAVKGYYQRFLTALPDIKALAEAPEDLLMKLWEGLGYYSRVRNLQKAARVIMTEYDGVFPSDYKAMLSLPGIGEYTAGAIGSVCFDLPEPAVDGNVLRIISRITENYNNILSPVMKKEITQILRNIYPSGELAYLFNQSMMELGATVCVPNGAPKCDICPVQQICIAYVNHT